MCVCTEGQNTYLHNAIRWAPSVCVPLGTLLPGCRCIRRKGLSGYNIPRICKPVLYVSAGTHSLVNLIIVILVTFYTVTTQAESGQGCTTWLFVRYSERLGIKNFELVLNVDVKKANTSREKVCAHFFAKTAHNQVIEVGVERERKRERECVWERENKRKSEW